jgi:predicted nucleic acid-binding protein
MVLIDAGPLIALFDKDDRYYRTMKNFIAQKSCKLISTIAVITEAAHMLDFDIRAQMDLLRWIVKRGVILHQIEPKDFSRIIELCEKYADLPMDFADATLVLAAEQTGIKEIISVDSDFYVYRLPGKEMIRNIFPLENA